MNLTVSIFVIVAAVAILVQMGILLALYTGIRKTSSRMESIAGRLEQQALPLLTTATSILEDAQPKIAEITSNLAESSATVRAHVSQVAEATGEIVERARFQALRVDELVGDTIGKIETASQILETKVLSPVRRVQAIVQAVNAGLGVLRSTRSRAKSARAGVGQDEEMFI